MIYYWVQLVIRSDASSTTWQWATVNSKLWHLHLLVLFCTWARQITKCAHSVALYSYLKLICVNELDKTIIYTKDRTDNRFLRKRVYIISETDRIQKILQIVLRNHVNRMLVACMRTIFLVNVMVEIVMLLLATTCQEPTYGLACRKCTSVIQYRSISQT